jgi:hypothetical protein
MFADDRCILDLFRAERAPLHDEFLERPDSVEAICGAGVDVAASFSLKAMNALMNARRWS